LDANLEAVYSKRVLLSEVYTRAFGLFLGFGGLGYAGRLFSHRNFLKP